MDTLRIKRCCTCKQYKEEEEFGHNKRTKDGLQKYCFECSDNHRLKYLEKRKASMDAWRLRNNIPIEENEYEEWF